MTIDLASREAAILEQLRDRYEAEGYQFFAEPGRELTPAFLGAIRPDAIAIKPGDRVIIEVKLREPSPHEEARLTEIARLVASQPGWRFIVLVEATPDGALRVRPSTRSDIARHFEEASALAAAGHVRAAFILGWAVLEAVARAAGPDARDRPLTPMQTIQELAMLGLIDAEAAARLRSLLALRNAIAHGDFGVAADPAALRFLIDLIGRIIPGMEGAAVGTHPPRQAAPDQLS